jgi:hypothetical protein
LARLPAGRTGLAEGSTTTADTSQSPGLMPWTRVVTQTRPDPGTTLSILSS